MRLLRSWILGWAVLPGTLGCEVALAQERPVGTVVGYVVHAFTLRGIAGADVVLEGIDVGTRADGAGRFELTRVPPGVYRLQVRSIGFQPYVQSDVVVGSGKPYSVTVKLTPQPVRLEGIEIGPTYFRPSSEAVTSVQTLNAEDTRRAPGVQEDVVRAVSLLPGVAITAEGRNDLVVRGGAPFENLFLVDGIEVPNINHFGSQGSTGGPLSLINIDFVQETRFSAGGFGVRYGDRTASVTEITLREGSDRGLAGELNLSATGFGAIAEGPIGGNTTFLLSARRSYLDLLFRAAGFSFVPAYWDFQLKTTSRLDADNTITFLGIGAINSVSFFNDDADDRFDNSRILAPEQKQYVAGVTWRRFLPNGALSLTLGRTFTRFRSFQTDSLSPPREVFRSFSREGETSLRADLKLEPAPWLELNVGNVAKMATDLTYDVELSGDVRLDRDGTPSPLAVDTNFTAFRNATYAQGSVWVHRAVLVTAGARVNYYDVQGGTFRVAPRAAVRLVLDASTALTLSGGRYYQAPSYIWLVGDPRNPVALEPIRADQVILGLQHRLRPDTRLQIEAFYKRYGRYPARAFRPQAVLSPSGFEDVTTDIPFGLEPLSSTGEGRAYGVEVFLQKRLSNIPLYGLASLTVSRSEFTALDGVTRAGTYDGRAIGNVVLGYRASPAWELSGKFRIASGLPTTPFVPTGADAGRLDFSRYNAGPRLPTFHALDLRVDRRWSFRGVQLETYLDVQNVYGRSNVSGFRWNAREQAPEPDESLGVLPTIGINIEF